jgi:soluble lytic murein transglycosylase
VVRSKFLPFFVVVPLLAAAQPVGPFTSPTEGDEVVQQPASEGPKALTPNKPEEEELSPPPEAEVALPAPGFTEIRNPAFPTPEALAPVVSKRKRPYAEGDLAPYFGQGNLAKAKAAYESQAYVQAAALLEKETLLPARYLRGLSLLKAQKYDAAAGELTALADVYPAMRDRCLTHAALAEEGRGHLKDAARLFSQIPPTSKLFGDARFGLARVLKRQGDVKAALAALDAIAGVGGATLGREAPADALFAQADLARGAKDAARERDALFRIWATHPMSGASKQADRRLRGQKPSTEVQVTRGESLVEAHRNRPGLTLLKSLLSKLKLPDELACRAQFAYGKALRKERDHQKAIEALRPVVEKCPSADLRARALYVLGSSQSIVDPVRGADTYERLAREFPAHPFADDALFYAADLYAKSGRVDDALKRLDDIVQRYPNGDFFSEALFRTYWIHRQRGDEDSAVKTLDRIEAAMSQADESYDVERARYWRARGAESKGNGKAAAVLFEKLALEHPSTYYGMMARGRLAGLEPERYTRVLTALATLPEPEAPWPLDAAAMADDPHFQAGVELLRMGFGDVAANEFLGVNRVGQGEEALRLLVVALAQCGDSRSAHAIARVALRRDLSGPVLAKTRMVWGLAYPNAFRPLVEKYSKQVNLDPDLLQALMREESALDPKVLSWAGALGLTQLMLPTAKAVAKELHLKRRVTADALLEPELNIQIGSAYLGHLVGRFNGNASYALASYNAGAGAVDRWRTDHSKLALDEWVEEIPVAETRGYVKRVLRSYVTYQMLNGHTAPAHTPAVGLR